MSGKLRHRSNPGLEPGSLCEFAEALTQALTQALTLTLTLTQIQTPGQARGSFHCERG